MEADLYDEFGNYIGPEIESDEESEDEDELGEEEAVEYVSLNHIFPYLSRVIEVCYLFRWRLVVSWTSWKRRLQLLAETDFSIHGLET